MSLQVKLYNLFLLDQQLKGLTGRLDQATGRLARQKKKIDQFNVQKKELHEQTKQLQVQASVLEKQSNEINTRVETLRNQMNSVKTNKEYSALLLEVNTLKAEKSKVEDQALEFMTKLDALKGQTAGVETQAAEQDKMVQSAQKDVTEAHAEISKELAELKARRDAAKEGIAPATLDEYARLYEQTDGEPVAGVSIESMKNHEYSCTGCYIGLPLERVNRLLRNNDEIVACPNCDRILCMAEEVRGAFVPKPKKGARGE
jgi:uncharacterized protein